MNCQSRIFWTSIAATLALVSSAKWATPDSNVPIDRLIQISEKRLRANPKDHEALFLLGRLYSLSYALNRKTVDVFLPREKGDLPEFPSTQSLQVPRTADKPPTRSDLRNLERSLDYYSQAKSLAPGNQLYRFALVWTTVAAARYASKIKWKSAPQPNTALGYLKSALASFRQIYRDTKATDLRSHKRYEVADAYLSQESGELILKLAQMKGLGGFQPGEKQDIVKTIAACKTMRRGITPIIFPVDGGGFDGLINESAAAKFDLNGFNDGSKWPWVTRKAGILCWDPESTGRITSGRQLFGNSTFWMFFKDGYAAMASLDDDQNGWLEGKELKGISVWIDNNENAVSEQGEVTPATAYGITRINTQVGDTFNSMPVQLNGIHLKNGQNLPTYDWTPISKP